jgi:hypothetical protein
VTAARFEWRDIALVALLALGNAVAPHLDAWVTKAAEAGRRRRRGPGGDGRGSGS